MKTITRRLAQLLTQSSASDLPAGVVHAAKRSVVNWIGAALGGCRDEAVRRALAATSEVSGPSQSTVIGHSQRLDMLNAALINAISSNILDFDDTHAHMVLHPTAPVACALLALSETRRMTGTEFLHALTLGVEVEARVLNPRVADYSFAWSPTATVGAMGAAAACGRVLGLNDQQTAWALGIAATQAGGLRETGGSMSKAFNAGNAARCGMLAALLAAKDFTGSETILEGPKGFVAAFGQAKNIDAIVESWGERYHIELDTFKPYPCGIVGHAAIDACLELHSEGVRAEVVESVQLTVHPVTVKMMGRNSPESGLDAKLSVRHTAAAALVYGQVGVKQFELACINDAEVTRLREQASLVADESYRTDEAEAQLVLRDGRVLKKHIEHAVGGLERPITDAGLESKLKGLAEDVLSTAQIDRLVELMWSFDQLNDASALARAVRAL